MPTGGIAPEEQRSGRGSADLLGSQLYAQLANLLAPPASLTAFPSCLALVEPVGKAMEPLDDLTDLERAEALSGFVNSIPAAAPTFLDSGNYYDDIWRFLLQSITPTAPPGSPEAATLASLVNANLFDLESMTRASLHDAGLTFHPVQTTPSRWRGEEGWTRVEFQLGGDAPSPAPPPPPKVVIPTDLPPLLWTTENQQVVLEPQRSSKDDRHADMLAGKLDTDENKTAELLAQLHRRLQLHAPWEEPGLPRPVAFDGISGPSSLSAGAEVMALRASDLVADQPTRSAVHSLRQNSGLTEAVQLPWRDAWSTTRTADLVSQDSGTEPAMSGFHLSFDYRLIGIRRPWLHSQLLRMSGWTIAGLGQPFSDGKAVGSSGLMPLLTTRMLVVKDLRVKASWSPSDAAQAASSRSISFGPFSVTGSTTFDGSELRQPGAQVVAWLAVVVPPCPSSAAETEGQIAPEVERLEW